MNQPYNAFPRHRNSGASLPLFEAADRLSIRALPFPARRLARRHGLPASTARTLADLIGYCGEAGR